MIQIVQLLIKDLVAGYVRRQGAELFFRAKIPTHPRTVMYILSMCSSAHYSLPWVGVGRGPCHECSDTNLFAFVRHPEYFRVFMVNL